MEFTSIQGKRHLIEPIGYNIVRKKILPGKMLHSAVTQFEIHRKAFEFKSNLLFIPEPLTIESAYSYTMKQIYEYRILTVNEYIQHIAFFLELCRYKQFMIDAGFWPRGFTVACNSVGQFMLFDFSDYGIIDKGYVKFPREKVRYTLDAADAKFSILTYIVNTTWDLHPAYLELMYEDELEKIEAHIVQ